ncbi:hypothetical protein RND71_006853 [Anisodus tanguticus]|uniref:Calponin-homology (CH) domain-containing protein n=1 Tax=Anisodus tanguticus TaxID=243964 RepID=A0AAE1SWX1_9SOLA|nr:hypothetical protein RND71_006853 [Anisodus tanguticus]
MAGYVGVFVSDPWLQSQFTQVELRRLKSHFNAMKRENGGLKLTDLPSKMAIIKHVGENLTEQERESFLRDSYKNLEEDVDFELFLQKRSGKNKEVYLKIQAHAAARMGNTAKSSSAFVKSATSTLLHTISESEKASYVAHINSYLADDEFLKKYLPIDPLTNDLFEVSKDGVLICKLINVAVPGTIDERAINMKRMLNPWERNENHTLCLNSAKAIGCTLVNIGTQDFIEGRIQLLADLNLKKTPQLLELVDDNKDAEAYAHLLNVLAPEYINPTTLTVKAHLERAKLVLEHVDRMGCKRYLTAKDIVEGSPNLNLAFVAHIFQHRWLLLETLDKVSPGIVNWKIATKPPIKMPFRKVENCNQVVKIGKQLKFSLVNIAGNDILMRCNMLQLLKNLRFHSNGKEITDADILEWSNSKVRNSGSKSRMAGFKDKSLSDGIFFLELLSAVHPRAVNWSLVTKGGTEEQKKMNATYIISIARKLGCSIFLLPEDLIEVNQKMMLTLTASIMYWHLKQPMEDQTCTSSDSDSSSMDTISTSTLDDTASECSMDDNSNR